MPDLPELKAEQIITRRNEWEERDWQWNGENSEVVVVINENALKQMIATAIREAIEEHEKGKKICP